MLVQCGSKLNPEKDVEALVECCGFVTSALSWHTCGTISVLGKILSLRKVLEVLSISLSSNCLNDVSTIVCYFLLPL